MRGYKMDDGLMHSILVLTDLMSGTREPIDSLKDGIVHTVSSTV